MPELAMPRLSDSMEEGTILKWLKSDGDAVAVGDELVEIETDKANMTHEAEQAGVLTIVAKEGETLPVGAVIARVGEAGDAPADAPEEAPAAEAPAEAAAEEVPAAEEPPVVTETPAADPEPVLGDVKASPVARRMARELGVSLASITGSGPGGRIVKADIPGASDAKPAAPAPAPAAREAAPSAPAKTAAPGTAKGTAETEELTRLQQVVARRMAESKATAPEFVIAVEAEMDEAVALRSKLKTVAAEGAAVPSFNDFVVKAAALALREFPRANGAYRDGRFELYSRVNVGVAVAAQEALVVPTVLDADEKSLGQIAADVRAVAERVRAGTVTPPELSGGTFTVSNLGMYGMRRIVPVINPPQAAILGVGALEPRAVVRDGEVVVRSMMDLTLVCDHRILYGADAAQFLARIRALLEQPLSLLL